ncbi:MAG: OmpH family outer membrane protein [Hyphomonadaceae bacterium]|nr:OmpH family outer membrane protein [Hyphomonadaceae bacterium]
MRIVSLIAAGAALALAPVAAMSAHAQQAGTVVVFNYDRVLADSTAGNDLETKLNQIRDQMRAEVQPEQQALQAENQRLASATQGQTADAIRANPQLTQQINDFQRRGQALAQREQTLARDLQYTQAQAVAEFDRQLTPIVREVMTARGAAAVLNTNSVALYSPTADVTDDIMTRFNNSVRTITVTRQSPPAPQAAAPAAPAAPAEPPASGRRRGRN